MTRETTGLYRLRGTGAPPNKVRITLREGLHDQAVPS